MPRNINTFTENANGPFAPCIDTPLVKYIFV